MKDPMGVRALVDFIVERDMVRVRKERGDPRPWTQDPILNRYRFCNVRRNDDTVTKWLLKKWYPQFVANPDYWFTAIVARLLNQPESLEAVKDYILPYKPQQFVETLQARARAGKKNFNAAYIVSTNGLSMDKVEYVAYNVLNVVWEDRERMRPKHEDTLDVYHRMLMSFDGLGSFIAAQVIGDLKYLKRSPLAKSSDWATWAASGPGSRRGLNRWRGYVPENAYKESEWRMDFEGVLEAVNEQLPRHGLEPLTGQDLQNCLCEWDKYERARLGEGTPKQLYKEKVQ